MTDLYFPEFTTKLFERAEALMLIAFTEVDNPLCFRLPTNDSDGHSVVIFEPAVNLSQRTVSFCRLKSPQPTQQSCGLQFPCLVHLLHSNTPPSLFHPVQEAQSVASDGSVLLNCSCVSFSTTRSNRRHDARSCTLAGVITSETQKFCRQVLHAPAASKLRGTARR